MTKLAHKRTVVRIVVVSSNRVTSEGISSILGRGRGFEIEGVFERAEEGLDESSALDAVSVFVAASPGRGAPSLAAREVAVLHFSASGCTGAQIAKRLRVSPSTVASDLRRVVAKLGTRDRGHAVAQAIRLGLVR